MLKVGDKLINGANGLAELTITKIGRKYIHVKGKNCEMQFISQGNGIFKSSQNIGVTAYTEEGHKRSLLIKKLDAATEIFRDSRRLGWGIKENVNVQELKSILESSLELVNQIIEIEKQ